MAKIREALQSLPAHPAVYISIALIVGVFAYRYGAQYIACTDHAALRDRLHDAVAAAARQGRLLVLAEVIEFDWDRVDIQTGFKPDVEVPGCPFGWDWSAAERDRLAAAGLLTVLVFSRAGAIVEYIEYRSDWGVFQDLVNPYDRETAVFSAEHDGGSVVLRPSSGPD